MPVFDIKFLNSPARTNDFYKLDSRWFNIKNLNSRTFRERQTASTFTTVM